MIGFTTKHIKLDSDIELAYTEEGDKRKATILFIHGLANYRQVWDWNIITLKSTFHCVSIDLPGCGLSSRGNYEFTLAFYADVIEQFCDALELKNVCLVGHSMGGQIACLLALRNKFPFEKLILFAPSGFEYYAAHEILMMKTGMQMGQWFMIDEDHVSQSILSSFYKKNENSKGIIDDLVSLLKTNDRTSYRNMIDKSMRAMMQESIYYKLQEISQEVLVFYGERDEFIPNRLFHPTTTTREVAIGACNRFQKARLITYPETGHFVHMEQSSAVNAEITAFLQRK